jgi:streptogramin lyase
VVFTNTANYTQTAYPITSTAQSGPYRIAVAGNEVWFTERGANRVGRLNAVTGQLDEFYGHGLSTNAGLIDIKVAPDGAVWMGGQTVQRLIRLTVSSPSVYAFTEYTDTARPTFVVAPSFLAVENSDLIWLTVPTANYWKVAQFTPSSEQFVWPNLPTGSLPMGVAATPGFAWLADNGHNAIAQVEVGTLTLVNSFGPITRPVEIAAETNKVFWMTQDDERGSIGRLIYTNTVSYRVDSFAMPVSKLRLTGIAAVPGSGVWSVAYFPELVYLPLLKK